MVEIKGAITPTTTIDSSNIIEIFTLPSEYKPSTYCVASLQQGSTKNNWLLRVETNGKVNFQRYGTTEYTSISEGTWLPLHVMYFVD